MENLESRIKKARKKAGLTQHQVAELIGVSHRSITSYEKDAGKITVKITQKIAIECKVDEIWLLTGQGSMEVNVPEKQLQIDPSNVTVIKHQNIINERLLEIGNISGQLFEKADSYIKGLHDAALIMQKTIKKKNNGG